MNKILLTASALCTCFVFAKKYDENNPSVAGESARTRAVNRSDRLPAPRFRPYQPPSGRGRPVARVQSPLSRNR